MVYKRYSIVWITEYCYRNLEDMIEDSGNMVDQNYLRNYTGLCFRTYSVFNLYSGPCTTKHFFLLTTRRFYGKRGRLGN